ncbi:hypothetical protein GUR46_03925 [Stenotrophomonas maltophilia]|uniref:site-specific integrase n=1 Tax=Stenotrophomonas maltophilia TaxID=40324 RepID=UPI001F43292A|nr:site-specific integrase [Stenotrophomonas maltophilia]MCF3528035.1 hypothetical protein [Stenotrophomonas maltophilia]MCF3531919.1 hypothetical protein [Stenotrophomonas maltophilia]
MCGINVWVGCAQFAAARQELAKSVWMRRIYSICNNNCVGCKTEGVAMGVYGVVSVRNLQISGRHCSRFPFLFSARSGAVICVNEFLIDKFSRGGSPTSLSTYAGHLREFLEQLEVQQLSLQEVTLVFMNGYREMVEARSSRPYAAQLMRTIVEFLVYLESRGAIVGVVGQERTHSIQVVVTSSGRVRHPLMRGAESPKSNQIPSDCAISQAKVSTSRDARVAERDELMIDWCSVKGLRSKEVCSLLVSQLPSVDEIERALGCGVCIEMRVSVTKGNKPRNILVHPALLDRTYKWVRTGRASIMRAAKSRARKRGIKFSGDPELFVSVTGKAHQPKSFSNRVRANHRKAVEDGRTAPEDRVWAHGLRKSMINKEVVGFQGEELLSVGQLMQQTGHGSIGALGRYVVHQNG